MNIRALLLSLLLPWFQSGAGPAVAAEVTVANARADGAVYYVNRHAHRDKDHEVHRAECRHSPNEENRIHLGRHAYCFSAVKATKRHYRTADGCHYYASACDTG